MTLVFTLSQWHELNNAFQTFFYGLGQVETSHERLHFRSSPPHVQTQFTIHANGSVNASMPLHGLEAVFQSFEFNQERNTVCCFGTEATYTYNVPQELLQKRSDAS
jgi:hypothetical protein